MLQLVCYSSNNVSLSPFTTRFQITNYGRSYPHESGCCLNNRVTGLHSKSQMGNFIQAQWPPKICSGNNRVFKTTLLHYMDLFRSSSTHESGSRPSLAKHEQLKAILVYQVALRNVCVIDSEQQLDILSAKKGCSVLLDKFIHLEGETTVMSSFVDQCILRATIHGWNDF